MARVVGVSGAAGSGKSTVVRQLAVSIPNSVVVHFDDYPVEMPVDLPAWLGSGADFDLWNAPELADDLARIAAGDRTVVFEAPLGRRHRATGSLIDYLVFIEVPLEIALARFVGRQLASGSPSLAEYIAAYEPVARDVYREQHRQVCPEADLVVDGLQPVDRIVRQIMGGLLGR